VTGSRLTEDDDLIDPELEAIAGAILDGAVVDFSAGVTANVEPFASDLQMIADIAALHRSLADDDDDGGGMVPAFPWKVGTLTITQSLGRGTHGQVFRAWDSQLHRDVAVKLLFAGERRASAAARVLDEGRLLARVRHPNVITVHTAEQIGGRIGLVTEYIEGHTLAEIVRDKGALTFDETARIGIDVCRALTAVHRAGLVHRDIKAQNVMRDESGRIVLMDFGAGLTGDTAPGVAGTPLYLAPEVIAGNAATPQSDIYSVGVLLYYLATGRYPVSGGTMAEIRGAHRAGARISAKTARPELPQVLAAAIDRALEPEPDARHASAERFEQALDAAIHPRRRRRAIAVRAGIATVVLALAGGAAVTWNAWRPRPVPRMDAASETISRLTVAPYYSYGGPSFDGRYTAHVGPNQSAWLTAAATGQPRRIVEGTAAGRVDEVILSSDGSQAAFTIRFPDNHHELRLVVVDDRWPFTAQQQPVPTVVFTTEPAGSITLLEWSRDDRSILFLAHRRDGSVELRTIDPAGSINRALETFTSGAPRGAGFSADGRYVVFDHAAALPSPQRDIFVVPADGSTAPRPLLVGNSNDELPIFSASGRDLLFVSDRGGSPSIQRVPVRDGALAGEPRMAAGGAHALTPIGLSAGGDYYYALQTKHEEIFSVALDPRGVASGKPVEVPGDIGLSRRAPGWSPDGDTLAFNVIRGLNLFDHGSYIGFADREGALKNRMAPKLQYFGGPPIRWSEDGLALLVRGKDLEGYWGFHRIDTATGAVTAAVRAEPRGEEMNLGTLPAWRPGGRSLVFVRDGAILERDFSGGADRKLVAAVAGHLINGLSTSPVDGRVAFSKTVKGANGESSVLVVRQSDGTLKELRTEPGAGSILLTQWSADGQTLVYQVGGPRLSRIFLIPASGGESIDTGVSLDGLRNRVSLRPDGRVLTFSSGATAFEIWVARGLAR
jgi:Tol biopolymer transport system component